MEYRGYTIEKFHSDKLVPKHIIREYYQSEKTRIDKMIELKSKREKNIENGFVERNMTEDIDDFLAEFYKD